MFADEEEKADGEEAAGNETEDFDSDEEEDFAGGIEGKEEEGQWE